MVPYAVTLAFGLGAIAASASPEAACLSNPASHPSDPCHTLPGQATQGLVWAAAASMALVVALLGSALAVTVNFSIARTKARDVTSLM